MKELCKTDNMTKEEWLKERKKGICGTDASAVVGLNSYRSAIDVWLDKTSDEVIVTEDNDYMRIGRDLEDYIASRWEEETGKKCFKKDAILQSSEYSFMLANVDRLVDGENAGLEIKTASPYKASEWADGKIPIAYEIQCCHYMAVTGADKWYICALVYPHIECRVIERDNSLMSDLISLEKEFWHNNVMLNVMPKADGSDASEKALNLTYQEANPNAEAITLDSHKADIDRINALNEMIESMTNEKKALQQSIQAEMGEVETAYIGDYQAIWKQAKPRKVLNAKLLRTEHPDIYEKYISIGTPTRRFTIKQLKPTEEEKES